MKKLLILGTGMLVGVAAFAINPTVFEDEYLTAISPNGKWIAGQTDPGSVVFRNLEDGKVYNYIVGQSITGAINNYFIGMANAVSNDGVIVGTTNDFNCAYWENGKWTVLNVPNPNYMAQANSITPDSRVICGGVGMDDVSEEAKNSIIVPAVWYRQDDGTYGDPVVLPHPALDFTGRVPMYITAVAISDDGKKVAGQVIDYFGEMPAPILYECDDDGNWTYTVFNEYLNPDNLEFPEYPGEYQGGGQPVPEWFMTPEEIAAWEEAMKSGSENYSPFYYMTDEEIAAYRAAVELWEIEYDEWDQKFDAFQDVYNACYKAGYSFSFNNVRISPDGKYYVTTSVVTYNTTPTSSYQVLNPVMIDTETKDLKNIYAPHSVSVTSVTEDYSVLVTEVEAAIDGYPLYRAYIFPEMQEKEFMPLEEFVAQRDPKVADWMEEMMIHDVYTGFNDFGGQNSEDRMVSGMPIATPDLSAVLCCTQTTNWVETDGMLYYSYLFPTGIEPSGVEAVEVAESNTMTVNPGGVVSLKGEFSSLTVVNIAGATVYSAANPAGDINTGLDNGIYIFKAVTADGKDIVRKVAL